MKGRKNRLGLILVLALGLAVAAPTVAQARTLFATTSGGKLISFTDKATKVKSSSKGKASKGKKKAPKVVQAKTSRTITGLPAGVSLVGIDFRPKTGELIGIGSDSTAYRVLLNETGNARALPVPPAFATALAGTSYGVDFNPAPDAIRIVSDAGQNLRITTPNTPVVNVDAALNPGTPAIVGAGYSNSGFSNTQPAATTTTLFTVDAASNTLNTQGSPGGAPVAPNSGTQLPVGPLGVDVSTTVGFDVVGSFTAPSGYLTSAEQGKTTLYTVSLGSGQATRVGEVKTLTKKGKTKIATLTGLAAVQD
ncbi:MAG: DUF4394 domain-containing protein [Actinomycetota bacterium]|nr:DUF4394 domain-containing protein [Actinomycetota bacterium]